MNKKLTSIATAALLVLIAGCSSIEIKGVVRDKPTGNPLSSATVSVGKESTSTNAMGAYSLEISDTSEAMIVNAPGYYMYSKTIGQDKINDIDLVPRDNDQ
ncbi:MAG: carboxypeptidase-like regulatory domain-containing protein [Methylovulum sp.]|nr:carboxypeptidase-like regulatory domain-containing protein [Methylovulum sp.]